MHERRGVVLVQKGEFAGRLEDCRNAAVALYEKVIADDRFVALIEPELDILVWGIKAPGTREMSELATRFFHKAEEKHLYLSLFKYPTKKIRFKHSVMIDSDHLVCLRSCLMKPEHLAWMDDLWSRVDTTMNEI